MERHQALVTGGSGFLGQGLVKRLRELGWECTTVSRHSASPEHVDHIALDLTDSERAPRTLSPWRWDAVINLAGPTPREEQAWYQGVQTAREHTQITMNVCNAIPRDWKGRLVHASGMTVYGNPDTIPVPENQILQPRHCYGFGKVLAEDAVRSSPLADRWMLRFPGLFSEERRSGAMYNFALRALAGSTIRVLPDRPTPWEPLHVDDAAEAIVRALQAKTSNAGPLNVGYGEPVTLISVAERLAQLAQCGAQVVNEGGAAHPKFATAIDKASALLGWPPMSLDERLQRFLRSIQGQTEST